MTTILGNRGQLWTSTLSPHLQSPHLDFPDFTICLGVRDCDVFVPSTLTPKYFDESTLNGATLPLPLDSIWEISWVILSRFMVVSSIADYRILGPTLPKWFGKSILQLRWRNYRSEIVLELIRYPPFKQEILIFQNKFGILSYMTLTVHNFHRTNSSAVIASPPSVWDF